MIAAAETTFSGLQAPKNQTPKSNHRGQWELVNARALVIEKDTWYRDRILVPSLRATGFKKVYTAETVEAVEREIRKHPEVAVIICNDDLQGGDGLKAVCRMANLALIPVVVLRGTNGHGNGEVGRLADLVVDKAKTSVLGTVVQVHEAARRGTRPRDDEPQAARQTPRLSRWTPAAALARAKVPCSADSKVLHYAAC
jgi:hypothetical protein